MPPKKSESSDLPALANPVPAPAPAPTPDSSQPDVLRQLPASVRIPEPGIYSGSLDVSELLAWTSRMKRYFLLTGLQQDDPKCITIVSFYLEGAALVWFCKQQFEALDELFQRLEDQFIPNWRSELFNQIEAATQRTRSVNDQTADLLHIQLQLPEISDDSLKHRMFFALNPALRRLVQPYLQKTNRRALGSLLSYGSLHLTYGVAF